MGARRMLCVPGPVKAIAEVARSARLFFGSSGIGG